MIRILLVLSIILTFSISSAEARTHHRHHAQVGIHPMCNITMPCTVQPNFLSGIRSISVSMHRDRHVSRHYHLRRHIAHYRHRSIYHKEEATHSKSAASVGSGVVKAASGAVAYVAAHATGAFQCAVNALEAVGYPVKFMGGYARGGHVRHSLHYRGLALDINQLSRNVTSPRMPSNEIAIANGCGLISGAQWANGDSGHFQLGGWAGYGNGKHYASRHHRHYAYRHRNHRHYARRHRHPWYAAR